MATATYVIQQLPTSSEEAEKITGLTRSAIYTATEKSEKAMSFAISKKLAFENIEQILSVQLSATALLKTINSLAHTTAKKHKTKQFELKTDAQKTAYIIAEHEFNVTLNSSKNMTIEGALKRMSEPRFWRKNIEKQVLKRLEHQAYIQKKLGRNRKEKCVSNKTLEYFDLKKEQRSL